MVKALTQPLSNRLILVKIVADFFGNFFGVCLIVVLISFRVIREDLDCVYYWLVFDPG
jgi:hypothetical protein